MAKDHRGNVLLAGIGRVVRARRVALGLSQDEASWFCGLDRSYFGGVERGERNVTVLVLEGIIHGLGVEPGELAASFSSSCNHKSNTKL